MEFMRHRGAEIINFADPAQRELLPANRVKRTGKGQERDLVATIAATPAAPAAPGVALLGHIGGAVGVDFRDL
jgi:hypothetical protein